MTEVGWKLRMWHHLQRNQRLHRFKMTRDPFELVEPRGRRCDTVYGQNHATVAIFNLLTELTSVALPCPLDRWTNCPTMLKCNFQTPISHPTCHKNSKNWVGKFVLLEIHLTKDSSYVVFCILFGKRLFLSNKKPVGRWTNRGWSRKLWKSLRRTALWWSVWYGCPGRFSRSVSRTWRNKKRWWDKLKNFKVLKFSLKRWRIDSCNKIGNLRWKVSEKEGSCFRWEVGKSLGIGSESTSLGPTKHISNTLVVQMFRQMFSQIWMFCAPWRE